MCEANSGSELRGKASAHTAPSAFGKLVPGPVACLLTGYMLLLQTTGHAAASRASLESEPAVKQLSLQLDELVAAYAANNDFSGVVAVTRGGTLLGEAQAGYSDRARSQGFDLETTFHVASLSKTFTAAAIRRLATAEKLALDDPLTRYLPEFPNGERITIRHLLGHRSGVPDYWALADVASYTDREVSLGELVTWLGSKGLDFEPGSNTSYSNSGYALLAAVIEVASGAPYHDYVGRALLAALGLGHTGYFSSDADAVGFSPAYARDGRAPSAPYDPSLLIGAGSLKSSGRDLLRWCESFLDEYALEKTPSMQYGWGARRQGGRLHVEQSGRNPGYSAHLRAYPESQTCVVVLSNLESDAVNAIGASASALAFGESAELPEKRQLVTLTREALAPFVGEYEIYPGTTLEVSLGPKGLLLRGTNGEFLPLEAMGDDRFFYRQLHTLIGAERGEGGAVTALLWAGTAKMPRVSEVL